MGISETPFCDCCLKTSKICWKSTQTIEDVGRIQEELLGLSAETIYFPFRCSIEASLDILQR